MVNEAMSQAGIVHINPAIMGVCKEFKGDYMKSSEYVYEIVQYLTGESIPFLDKQIMGIYFDNPANTPEEELKSWQGVLIGSEVRVHPPFFVYRIEGEYVSIKMAGDPAEVIGKAYEQIFRYIYENDIRTQSREGIQLMRMVDNAFEIQILMKIA